MELVSNLFIALIVIVILFLVYLNIKASFSSENSICTLCGSNNTKDMNFNTGKVCNNCFRRYK